LVFFFYGKNKQCVYCEKYKTADCFYQTKSNACKECICERDKQYINTNIGHVNKMLSHMRSHSRGHDEPEFTTEEFKQLIEKQGMLYPISIPERIDTKKGYTKENTILVCNEFNTSDNSKSKNVIKKRR